MPAIDPARLKRQSAALSARYEDPQAFVRGLIDLLERYADRTRRPGQSGTPPPLLPAYHVPRPVIRQIMHDLGQHLHTRPEQALELAKLIWKQTNWECRVLAIQIFSRLPVTSGETVLAQLQVWAAYELEDQLLQLLLTEGVHELRKHRPELLLRQARNWLSTKETEANIKGLILLSGLVGKPDISDPPEVFRMLKRLIIHSSPELRSYIHDVLVGLIETAPQETAFFLDQCLEDARSEDAAVIVRGVLSHLPAHLQPGLRTALRLPR